MAFPLITKAADLPSPPQPFGISRDIARSLTNPLPGRQLINPEAPSISRNVKVPDGKNFNQLFPYYFAIWTVSSSASSQGEVTVSVIPNEVLKKIGISTNSVSLDIAPSQISVSNQFAINVSATNKGILEENNGMVFRTIQIAGTTGFLPHKFNRNSKPGLALKIAQQLFPSASSAITGLLNPIKKIAKAMTGGQDNDLNDISDTLDLTATGYYRFWELNNFLLLYAEAKKKSFAEDLRLVFVSAKDCIGYVVSPVTFDLRRDVSNPLLYRYQIVLKAWDTVKALADPIPPDADIPSPDSQSIIKSLTDVLVGSRQTIQGARNVLSSAHSDLDSIFNIYNQTLLLYQDTAGIVSDVRTFFGTFESNRQALLLNSNKNRLTVIDAVNSFTERGQGHAVTAADVSSVQKSDSLSDTNASLLSGLGIAAPKIRTTPGGEDKTDTEKKNVSPSADTVVSQALKTDTFLNTTVDQLDLPDVIQSGIDLTRQQSQSLTAGNVRTLISDLQSISDNYANTIGAMDPVYAATFGLPVFTSTSRLPTEDDIIVAAALQESKSIFLSTLATGQFFKERDSDPFLSANEHLPPSDQLETPFSSVAVPFQRGATLDRLAQQYLGSAKRSREIVVLNNLRAPYIDEVGFTQSILEANGRSFVVTDISRLTISQQITLRGTSVVTTRRQILNVEDIGGGEWRVTVDGVANLSIYTPSSSPSLFARLPGTVGPGDTILIPGTSVPDEFAAIRPTSLFNRLSHAEQVFKIDIALDSIQGKDISVSATGDAQRSFGYNNAVQALRLALEVERGELDKHPGYGLPTPVGARNSDVNPLQAENMIRASITNDPRFTGADVALSIKGNAVEVNIAAQGAAGTGQIPVSFEIGKQ